MKGAVPDPLQVFLRIVAFVKNQGNVASPLGQRTATFQQLLGDALEGHRVVLIPRVGVMKQGNFAIGSNQQGQAQNPQVVPPLFAMTSLR